MFGFGKVVSDIKNWVSLLVIVSYKLSSFFGKVVSDITLTTIHIRNRLGHMYNIDMNNIHSKMYTTKFVDLCQTWIHE